MDSIWTGIIILALVFIFYVYTCFKDNEEHKAEFEAKARELRESMEGKQEVMPTHKR